MSSTFLAVPLKATNEVDLVKPLAHYIETMCEISDDIKAEMKEAVQELNKLRNKACIQPLDKHQSALDVVTRCDANFIKKGGMKTAIYFFFLYDFI